MFSRIKKKKNFFDESVPFIHTRSTSIKEGKDGVIFVDIVFHWGKFATTQSTHDMELYLGVFEALVDRGALNSGFISGFSLMVIQS